MGLFDGSLTGDPTGDLGVIGGLLTARVGSNWPQMLMQAGVLRQAQQKNERENRANDLQQLQGAYTLLKQQEFGRMATARQQGLPYTPNPMLQQMESKLGELTGLPKLSGAPVQAGGGQQMPQATALPQQMPPQAPQGPLQQGMGPQQPQVPPQRAQAPQGATDGFGGPAGGIPFDVWMAQDPTGKGYITQLAKDNEPKVLREGDLVGRNPDGSYGSLYQQPKLPAGIMPQRNAQGQVSGAYTLPGFTAANAGIQGAETTAKKAAEAPYDIKMVTQADGSIVPMPVSRLMGGQSGTPAPQAAASGVARLDVTQPSRQAQIPQPQAGTPAADPFADIPKVPQHTGIGQSTYSANMDKLRSDQGAKLFETYGNNADSAQQRMAVNQQALSLLDRADTGTGAAMIGDVKKALVTRFGIPESDFSNDPTATSILQKDLLNAATARAKQQFGARMTQSEVMMMLSRGAPNVDMTKEAIRFLMSSDNIAAQYEVDRANHYGEYIARGGDPLRFQGYYSQKFPLSKAEEKLAPPAVGGNAPALRYDKNGDRVQ